MSKKKKQKTKCHTIGSFNTIDKVSGKSTGQKAAAQKEANIGWLFSKDYYLGLDDIIDKAKKGNGKDKKIDKELSDFFEKKNKSIVGKELTAYEDELDYLHLPYKELDTLKLTTIYPGLFTGGGIPHETGTMGEFKLGFFFDHTTGLPIIPGSSVKGLLRSAFKHPDYIAYLLNEILGDKESKIDINALEAEIFAGEKKENGKTTYIPIAGRDIFFDAVIDPSEDGDGKFLGIDFITPHRDEFKDPNPLQFLKVLPRVTFCFQFILRDGINGIIKAGDKLKLFEHILLDLGIGAKTNVGYGKLEKNDKERRRTIK